ncbi:MAG: hypothetical protein QM731_09045 [Chitinophagaceae bacterium]
MNKALPFLRYAFITFLLLSLISCQPLDFKIFFRNQSSLPVQLTLRMRYAADSNKITTTLPLRYDDSILPINNKTLAGLQDTLKAILSPERQIISLTVPPRSTVYISDVFNVVHQFAPNQLIIEQKQHTDTLRFEYPFRKIKGLHRKRDTPFNLFYRLILWYDIKD